MPSHLLISKNRQLHLQEAFFGGCQKKYAIHTQADLKDQHLDKQKDRQTDINTSYSWIFETGDNSIDLEAVLTATLQTEV